MSDLPCGDPARPRPNTARAFLLAPGIAAAVGGVGTVLTITIADPPHYAADSWALIAVAPLFLTFFFALVGYPTAAVIGVPVYLFLPEQARRCFAVVVPLAGAIAAAPWICADPPWRSGGGGLQVVAGLAFALGVVAGIAFLFLRRPPGAVEAEP